MCLESGVGFEEASLRILVNQKFIWRDYHGWEHLKAPNEGPIIYTQDWFTSSSKWMVYWDRFDSAVVYLVCMIDGNEGDKKWTNEASFIFTLHLQHRALVSRSLARGPCD